MMIPRLTSVCHSNVVLRFEDALDTFRNVQVMTEI